MFKRLIIIVSLLPVLALIIFCVMNPTLSALFCPTCFGYENFSHNIYIESKATSKQKENLTKNYLQAKKQVENVYGPLVSNPLIIASVSQDQHDFIGGGKTKGEAYGATAIKLSPKGLNSAIIAHELAHIELHTRIGALRSYRKLPAWFDEGLAVLISEDERYTGPPRPDEFSEKQVMELTSSRTWRRTAKNSKEAYKIYSPAYRIVRKWFDKAGPEGIQELIKRMKNKEDFQKIYNELGDRV